MILALFGLIACGPKYAYPDGRGLEGQLEREVVALNQRVRSLEGQLESCTYGGEPGPVYASLHQLFSGSEIVVDRRGGLTVVTLPAHLLFTDGSGSRMREEAAPSLDLLATVLKTHPDLRVVVEGHTHDAMLSAALARSVSSHMELSLRYASAVAHRLAALGVGEARFTIAGRGRWAPVASNDTLGGQARNQRVEVHVFPPGAR